MSVCDLIQPLAHFELDALSRINRKLIALQRLAALLEQLGNIGGQVPNLAAAIGSFLPVASIDANAYSLLARTCPLLGLPPFSGAALVDLQALLAKAYAGLIGNLQNHPWMRMGALQAELNKFAFELNSAVATSLNFLACLQSACNLEGLFAGNSALSIGNQYNAYKHNVANGLKVLSPSAQAHNSLVNEMVTQLKVLGAAP